MRWVASIALAFATAGCGATGATKTSSAAARRPDLGGQRTPAAIVAGIALPRSVAARSMSSKLASYRASYGTTPDAREYRLLRDQVIHSLVQDMTVVIEARRLHLAPGRPDVLMTVLTRPVALRSAYEHLYAFAARRARPPHDPRVVAAMHVDQHLLGDFLTPRQLQLFQQWQARRDRVASAWFSSLFRRYASRKTRYAADWRPQD